MLHDKERRAGLVADIVERTDVRMIQCGDRACFAIESFAQGRITRDSRWQYLDGDGTIESRIARPIHLAHAACARAETISYMAEARAPE